MHTERWVAANPQTKPTNIGCESADPSTIHIRLHHLLSLLSLKADTHFTIPRRVESCDYQVDDEMSDFPYELALGRASGHTQNSSPVMSQNQWSNKWTQVNLENCMR